MSERAPQAESPPVIDCRQVWKVFAEQQADIERVIGERLDKDTAFEKYNAVVAVSDASFSVNRGEIFCIMGLSGSGKSTLVRHINRLIEPSAGGIFINGADIGQLAPEQLRSLRSDSIAIMKDGALVQIGTPETIVLSPVDEYVEDFVQGISKLTLISARTIMKPIDATESIEDCPQVDADCDLKGLIDLALDSDKPAVVIDDAKLPVGVITTRTLLAAIRGDA